MTVAEQRKAAREFADYWQAKTINDDDERKGNERSQSQPFWLSLLRDVYGVEHPEQIIEFESKVMLDHASYIDGMINSTHVLIEQKSKGTDLDASIKQSDGQSLTPFRQAIRYVMALPVSKHPRWIVTCNFEEFRIYDMERPNEPPETLLLEDLPDEVHRLQFLVDPRNEHIRKETDISIKAGEIVGKIYDALREQYLDPDSEKSRHALNVLCVRLVFCLYAESAGIFGRYGMFGDYLRARKDHARDALLALFKVLDQKEEERDPYLDKDLAAFPYVNGGLFRLDVEIPCITPEIVGLILHKASGGFKWRDISPAIFGAIFESTLNPETRRSHGMHYTSLENIHKVIDPLFLDDLRADLEKASSWKTKEAKKKHLKEFRAKLSSLKILDPACGSGNFLTESYLWLRRLENKAIRVLNESQIEFADANPIQVSIEQFYGIELNDFAVSVAQTALWIAEAQMRQETAKILNKDIESLPLKTAAHIVEGNALRIDWNDVVPRNDLHYIIGNPPFVGKSFQTPEQKADMQYVLSGITKAGNLDYVACWFRKASDFAERTPIQCAFVATNSLCQGVAVPPLWSYLLEHGVHIDFAYRTFPWSSQATAGAHVYVIVIGFSCVHKPRARLLYLNDEQSTVVNAKNINPYLLDASNVIVVDRAAPVADVSPMQVGSFPTDGGNLVITEEEYESFWKVVPERARFVRPYIGPDQLINGTQRYCLWLRDSTPAERRSVPAIMDRIRKTKAAREHSTKIQTQRRADTPHLFAEDRQPDSDYVMIPRTSSERRRYIPMGFFSPDVIAGDVIVLPHATLFEFGIIMSSAHMAWMRTIAGRLKSDYRYSPTLVYNTFPWPAPTPEQKERIENTAQAILDARALFPDSSLNDMYDEDTMPLELRKAHAANDKAVMAAYGMKPGMEESQMVTQLMQMYAELVRVESEAEEKQKLGTERKRRKKRA